MVDPVLRPILAGHWFAADFRAACSSEGGFFVWPVRDGDETVEKAADAGRRPVDPHHVEHQRQDYTIEAGEEHDEPAWSDAKFEDLLESALAGRILADAEDEIVEAVRKKKVQIKDKAKKEDKKTTKAKKSQRPSPS